MKRAEWRPTIMLAMVGIVVIAVLVILKTPEHVVQIAGSAITGIGMLGMTLLKGGE